MTRLQQIEQSIAALTGEELRELGTWFDDLRWERWDRQIEADSKAGRLDRFLEEAKA